MSFSDLVYPFEWIVSWILFSWHWLFTTLGIPSDSGVAWTLSIVGLVVVMRAAMIPLFVKQIHASRRMQLIQPEMQKIQAKYKDKKDPDSRQAMTQETMDLYKRTGTNPFSSCLPILLQSPFFFGLFRVLNNLQKIANGEIDPIGPITAQARRPRRSRPPSSVPSCPTSSSASVTLTVKIVTVVLIILMSASTFTTQRQLMMKNMPASALDNPFAKQQKMLLYLMPIFFAISGVNFPIGVLLYWLTTNVWSMCQQFYVIRNMPAPGLAGREGHAGAAAQEGQAGRGVHRQGPRQARRGRGAQAQRPAACSPRGTRRRRATGTPPSRRAAPAKPKKAAGSHRPQAPDRQLRVTTMTEHNDTVVDDTAAPSTSPPTTSRAEPTDTADEPTTPHRDGRRRRRPTPTPSASDDEAADAEDCDCRGRRRPTGGAAARRRPAKVADLEREGEVAADFLETLLDIADLDGDIDVDVDGDRAAVSIVDSDEGRVPRRLVGQDGKVLEALQELTRLAVQSATGERSRLMLDVAGHRAERRVDARRAGPAP